MWSAFRKKVRGTSSPPEGSESRSPVALKPQFGLQLLYDGTQHHGYESENDNVDIIAVHGLNGDPIKSFTDPSSGVCWLRDFLPQDVPGCRVFSYGYDAAILSTASAQPRAHDIARNLLETTHLIIDADVDRPLIFLGHNLGGLVIKRMLTIATLSPERYDSVVKRISGILFFGTPHQGSSKAVFSETILKLLQASSGRSNKHLIREMQVGSDEAQLVNSSFLQLLRRHPNTEIYSFYEELPTSRAGIIVDRSSAVLHLPRERILALHKTHANLCRFGDKNDPSYSVVVHALKDLCKYAAANRRSGPDTFVEPLAAEIVSSSMASPIKASTDPLSTWMPAFLSKSGPTAMGLLAMAGSMEDPRDFSNAEIDVIAVHGLGGSPVRTWIHKEAKTLWLRDFLVPDIPNARVMSYGYSAELAFKDGAFDITTLAKDFLNTVRHSHSEWKQHDSRPIVMIGYNFGGLLIKKALLLLKAGKSPSYQALHNAIANIIFLGVPHGSDTFSITGSWTGIISCTVGIERFKSEDLSNTLDEAVDIAKQFQDGGFDSIHVSNITESEPTRVPKLRGNLLLVPTKLALLGWGDRETVFLASNRDHFQLPTFVDANDPTYVHIRDVVGSAIFRFKGAKPLEEERKACLSALRRFSGDQDALFESIPHATPGTCDWIFDTPQMEDWLRGNCTSLLITGDPGSGKTVLAKHIALTLENDVVLLRYFCSFNDVATKHENQPLVSLLYQLFRINPSLMTHAMDKFRSDEPDFATSPLSLWTILSSATNSDISKRVVVLIDAIDEFPPEPDILQLLNQLATLANVKLLITARGRYKPTSILETLAPDCIDLQSIPNDSLKAFVAQSLNAMPYQISPDLRKWLEEQMEYRINRTFLQASLMMRMIENTLAIGAHSELRERVEALPTTISDVYRSYLEQCRSGLSSVEWGTLTQILRTLLVYKGPIALDHLPEVLDMPFSYPQLRRLNSWDLRKIIEKCPIIHLDSSHQLRFIHSSAFEYMSSSDEMKSPGQSALPLVHAHLEMATRCISRLYVAYHEERKRQSSEDPKSPFLLYSAKHWTHHVFQSQDLMDSELNDNAYRLLQPGAAWLALYEDQERGHLPYHGMFEPLFGAAYFGLYHIAREALRKGADIEAQDEEGKTALHWASEHGHTDIARLLLDNGASVTAQTFAGWSSLLLAAKSGHVSTLKLLLDRNADINSRAADGRQALQVAIEAGQSESVRILLSAGADVTQGSYSGLNIVRAAERSEKMLSALLQSPSVCEKLFLQAIFDNDSETLDLLFRERPNFLIEQYPWVGELLQEDMGKEEILDLLLKSENLDWIDDEDLVAHKAMSWKQIPQFNHLEFCAHTLKNCYIDSDGELINPNNNRDSDVGTSASFQGVSASGHGIRAQQPYASGSTLLKSTSLDPERQMEKLEELEERLIHTVGVGGVFPPTQSESANKLNPGFARMRHQVAHIMYGDRPMAYFSSLKTIMEIPALQSLGKNLSKPEDDVSSLYSISTDGSQESDGSYDSFTNDDNYEIWDQGHAQRILESIKNILNGVKHLDDEGECCDRFTVLVRSPQELPSRPGRRAIDSSPSRHRSMHVIEMKAIETSSLKDLCGGLEEFCDASEARPHHWTGKLAETCLQIFINIGYKGIIDPFLHENLGSSATLSPTRCLHACALIAQIASVALVTYSRGHSRDFYAQFLTRPINYFVLGGLLDYGPSFCAERVDLACLGNMLGRKVWVFHTDIHTIGTSSEKFSLSTNVENLLDTWGGRVSMRGAEENAEIRIHIGAGFVTPASLDATKKTIINETETYCHWVSEHQQVGVQPEPVRMRAQLLIGATTVNTACSLTTTACQTAITNRLVTLGTRLPSWKLNQLASGFTGGQWFNWNLTATYTRDDGRSLKRLLIDDFQVSHDIWKLNNPWGLELSLCTGIAKRVLLRHMMYGEVLQYLELRLPGEWSKISQSAARVAGLSDAEFEQLIRGLTKEQKEVWEKATELLMIAMEFTGVGKDGHTLTLWWPERGSPSPRGVQIVKAQYSGANPWISMIQDSDHTAVFALATARCLQHDNTKTCQHPANVTNALTLGQMTNIMLDTTLTPAEVDLVTLAYAQDSRYVLWKRADLLKVTRPVQNAQGIAAGVVHMTYIPSRGLPPIVSKALKRHGKLQKVREKENWTDPGQSVLIL